MLNYFKKRYILKIWTETVAEDGIGEAMASIEEFCALASRSQKIEAEIIYQWILEFENKLGDEYDGEYEVKTKTKTKTKPQSKPSLSYSIGATAKTSQPISNVNLLYESDKLIEQLSSFPANLLIATRPGGGKSTLLNAIIYQIISRQDNSEVYIVDPKTNTWLGLERSAKVVTYLAGTDEQQLQQLSNQINRTAKELNDRISKKQEALRQGKRAAKYSHYYLILDEWYTTFNCLLEGNTKHSLVLALKNIINKGRELLIHTILVSQSHQCGDVGFTKSGRDAFDFVCLGSSSSSFEPLFKFAGDNNVLSNSAQREQIGLAIEQGIKQCKKNRLAVVTLNGLPHVTILPDLSYANKNTVELHPQLLEPETEPIDVFPPSGYTSDTPIPGTSTAKKQGRAANFDVSGCSGSVAQDSEESYKTLFRLQALLRNYGCSDTQIIEYGFSCGGRKYEQGRAALQKLREIGDANNW